MSQGKISLVSVGGLVCQLVLIPEEVTTPDQLDEFLVPMPLLHTYGRVAVGGGASEEIRLLAITKILFYCGREVSEMLERSGHGYRVVCSHDYSGPKWFSLSGEPIERIAQREAENAVRQRG